MKPSHERYSYFVEDGDSLHSVENNSFASSFIQIHTLLTSVVTATVADERYDAVYLNRGETIQVYSTCGLGTTVGTVFSQLDRVQRRRPVHD